MNILVSNDDGIEAKGLHVLVDALSRVPGNQVYVAAPDGQRSACGHGISMFEMLKIDERQVPGAVWARAVSGTPADSVKFGMKYLAREENVRIDVVFSGINHGGNIGSDVHYSGTVSAAAEGLLCGVPAVAVSLGTHHPTDEMLENCSALIQDISKRAVPELEKTTLLNVNFPPVPPAEIKGLRVTRLGPREYDERFDLLENPSGQKYCWYSGRLVQYEGLAEDIDTAAQQEGFISITPLKLDMTDYELRDRVRGWNLKY